MDPSGPLPSPQPIPLAGAESASPFESSFDPRSFDTTLPGSAGHGRWIGWRLRLLVLCALLGCLSVFLIARWLADQPTIDAVWRADAQGRIELMRSDEPELRALQGRVLSGVVSGASGVDRLDGLLLQRSARWLVDVADRAHYETMHEQLAGALSKPSVQLIFGDRAVQLTPQPRGYASLGAMFWVLCAMGLLLYTLAMVVVLARPGMRNLVYAVMALCQAGTLILIGIESTLLLAMPAGFAGWDLQARIAFDMITGAAIVQSTTLHPTRLRGALAIALGSWSLMLALLLLAHRGLLPDEWWWVQGGMLLCGGLAIGLLTWSYRVEPHPFAALLRRFAFVAVGSMLLLTLAVGLAESRPLLQQGIAAVGTVAWHVFLSALLLLVPFLSRSQQLIREFSLLAAVSVVATALDLLFVTVFSLGQFASLTLALFLALGVYAGARQWVLNQLLGNSMLTTERMFEQLYRIAREVEAHPESAAPQLSRLLRELFEPLEVLIAERSTWQTRIVAEGSTLLVPVPDLGSTRRDGTPGSKRSVVIRFAHRGRRLFTVEDARLADRVVDQLRRAIAFDKAVEQGRSEERARLAQDLHDDIGARLLTLMYKAQTPEMEDYVRHTLQDLKTLTRGLAAPHHRLSHAAAEWKADLTQRLALAHVELGWTLSYDEDLLLSVVQWSALTRVLRELVSNAISHAKATRVTIDFSLDADQLDLLVSDNGEGRNPRAWAHGLGLNGVRKRVKQLGGDVEWLEVEPHGIACKVRIRDLSQRR